MEAMVPYRRTEGIIRAQETKRESLIRAAEELFAQRGYSGTTMRDVASAAAVALGTVYRYFHDKDELFQELFTRFLALHALVAERALGGAGGSIVRGFARSKAADLWLFHKRRGLARALFLEATAAGPRFAAFRDELMARSDERILEVFVTLSSVPLIGELGPRRAAILCNGTVYAVIMDMLKAEGGFDLRASAVAVTVYNLNALLIDFKLPSVEAEIDIMLKELEEI
jgi:AcrR family transcriptional regulator